MSSNYNSLLLHTAYNVCKALTATYIMFCCSYRVVASGSLPIDLRYVCTSETAYRVTGESIII